MSAKSTRKGKIGRQLVELRTILPMLDQAITALDDRLTELEVKVITLLTPKPVDAIGKDEPPAK